MTAPDRMPAGRRCWLATRAPSLKTCRPDLHNDGPDWAVILVVERHQQRAHLDHNDDQQLPSNRSDSPPSLPMTATTTWADHRRTWATRHQRPDG